MIGLRHIVKFFDIGNEYGVIAAVFVPIVATFLCTLALMNDFGVIAEQTSREATIQKADTFINDRLKPTSRDALFGAFERRDGLVESRLVLRIAQDGSTFDKPYRRAPLFVAICFVALLIGFALSSVFWGRLEPLVGDSRAAIVARLQNGARLMVGILIGALVLYCLYALWALNLFKPLLSMFGGGH